MTGAPLTLTGYGFSVYTRSVRMALAIKALDYGYIEVDPFDPDQRGQIPHPFGRVPVLTHGGFRLYETQAILDYLQAMWPDTSLLPDDARAQARMRQVMGIVDSYVYGTMVRQVVSQALFAPLDGRNPDQQVLSAGWAGVPRILQALDEIAAEGRVLTGKTLTLADVLLWPMIDYLLAVEDGAAALKRHTSLQIWCDAMTVNPAAHATRPDLERYQG